MIVSAGISHIVVCIHGPGKFSSYWPSRLVSSYSGNWKFGSQARKSGSKICRCHRRCYRASQIISFLEKRGRPRMIELLAQLLLVDLVGKTHRLRAVDQRRRSRRPSDRRPRSSAASAACRNPYRAGCGRSDRASSVWLNTRRAISVFVAIDCFPYEFFIHHLARQKRTIKQRPANPAKFGDPFTCAHFH